MDSFQSAIPSNRASGITGLPINCVTCFMGAPQLMTMAPPYGPLRRLKGLFPRRLRGGKRYGAVMQYFSRWLGLPVDVLRGSLSRKSTVAPRALCWKPDDFSALGEIGENRCYESPLILERARASLPNTLRADARSGFPISARVSPQSRDSNNAGGLFQPDALRSGREWSAPARPHPSGDPCRRRRHQVDKRLWRGPRHGDRCS